MAKAKKKKIKCDSKERKITTVASKSVISKLIKKAHKRADKVRKNLSARRVA